jgi:hypothetical protein
MTRDEAENRNPKTPRVRDEHGPIEQSSIHSGRIDWKVPFTPEEKKADAKSRFY